MPPEITQHTIVLDFNDCEQLEAAFVEHGDSIACVMVEPIAGNMNLVRSTPDFIAACDRYVTATARCWCSTR